MIDNASMRSQNFKSLVTKAEKTLKKFKGGVGLVIVDNYNVLANGSYTETAELDLVEFFNSLHELAANASLAVGVNRDLFCSETEAAFYREVK